MTKSGNTHKPALWVFSLACSFSVLINTQNGQLGVLLSNANRLTFAAGSAKETD